ncbi:MAG: cation:proton antiporter, partial [Pseudomonadota bacterium]
MDGNLLFSVFIFLAAACIAVPISSRIKLGSVLGYLIAGVLIGPYGLRFINNTQEVMHLAEFGVVMMLFVIGLELEPEKLWRLRKSIVGFGGLQVVLTTTAITGFGMMRGFDLGLSLAVGMALSLSSTALVLQMLQERNLTQTSVGESALSILLFQDIAVIPILIILPLFAIGAPVEATQDNAAIWLSAIPGWAHALLVAAAIALVIAFGRLLSRHLFGFIVRTNLREMFTAVSLALVIGVALLMLTLGVSPAL